MKKHIPKASIISSLTREFEDIRSTLPKEKASTSA
jgi:hypothetical protein